MCDKLVKAHSPVRNMDRGVNVMDLCYTVFCEKTDYTKVVSREAFLVDKVISVITVRNIHFFHLWCVKV